VSVLAEGLFIGPWGRVREVEVQTGRDIGMQPPILHVSSVPLFDLELDGVRRRLAKPLRLSVSVGGGRYVVENDTLGLIAWGDSPDSAVAELRRDIQYFIAYYRKLSSDEVEGNGLRLKEQYETLLA